MMMKKGNSNNFIVWMAAEFALQLASRVEARAIVYFAYTRLHQCRQTLNRELFEKAPRAGMDGLVAAWTVAVWASIDR